MAFKIVTDTSANLPIDYVEKNDISVLPFTYYIDDVPYTTLDYSSFDSVKFYQDLRSGKKIRTSQVNSESFEACFGPILQQGFDIIYISMSSAVSGAFNSARLAKEELLEQYPDRKIHLVDTKGAGLGEGMFVFKAVEKRDAGEDVDSVFNYLDSIVPNMCHLFTVDDLKFLQQGGRLSNAEAFIGSLLNIKPILIGDKDGKIVSKNKVRGRKNAIKKIASEYEEKVVDPANQVVCISHGDCIEDAQYLAQLVREGKNPPKDILIELHEPATACHVGPGMLALYFWSDDHCREF